MSPGMLVVVVAVIWLGVLIGLFRVLAQMERVEREIAALNTQGRPPQEVRRG